MSHSHRGGDLLDIKLMRQKRNMVVVTKRRVWYMPKKEDVKKNTLALWKGIFT